MKTAGELLRTKPDQRVYSIAPTDSVYNALELMAQKNIGALLVMEGTRIAGIVTERDYARKIVLMSRGSRQTQVADIMISRVMYVRPDQTTAECMALMTDKRIRHLPVVDDGALLGVISIGDLVKEIISEQRFVIDQLEQYIRGTL